MKRLGGRVSILILFVIFAQYKVLVYLDEESNISLDGFGIASYG